MGLGDSGLWVCCVLTGVGLLRLWVFIFIFSVVSLWSVWVCSVCGIFLGAGLLGWLIGVGFLDWSGFVLLWWLVFF